MNAHNSKSIDESIVETTTIFKLILSMVVFIVLCIITVVIYYKNDSLEYLPKGILIVFCCILVYISYIFYEHKRIVSIIRYCEQNGLEYFLSKESIPNLNEKFYITFGEKYISYNNIMLGECSGINYSILDVEYISRIDKRKCTICILNKPGYSFLRFHIKPKTSFISRMEDETIELDDKDFSKKLLLCGPNEYELKKYFSDPRIKKTFLFAPRPSWNGFYYEFEASNEFFVVKPVAQILQLNLNQRLELLNNSLTIYNAITHT